MDSVTMFHQKVIDIDDENTVIVYAESSLLPNETIRILEIWMQRFLEETMYEL